MKYLFLVLCLAPFTAHAATNVSCQSFPVDFAITSDGSITASGTKLSIVANGVLETGFTAQVDVVESALPPLAVVNVTTIDGLGRDNPESSIHARLEIPLVKQEDGSVVVSGSGKIQITKIPPQHPSRLRPRYDLSGCTGTL